MTKGVLNQQRILDYLTHVYPHAATLDEIARDCRISYDRAQQLCQHMWSVEGTVTRDWQNRQWRYAVARP
jgi:hypothetical protein